MDDLIVIFCLIIHLALWGVATAVANKYKWLWNNRWFVGIYILLFGLFVGLSRKRENKR